MAKFTEEATELSPEAAAEPTYRQVAVKLLEPCPWNPRKVIAPQAIDQLAASMRQVGVLQPLVVRVHPKKKNHFEILAGERRYLAAQAAGLETVPANVRELDDKAAMEITVIENLLREQLHPLEEAAGFATLIEKGWDVASIASRFKHSPNWVAKRIALNDLIEPWRKRYAKAGDALAEIPLGVIEGIARLSPEIQKDLLSSCQYGPPHYMQDVKGFNKHVAGELLHVLSAASWKLDDATLSAKAGACTACPKRSSQTPHLFDDLDGESSEKKAARDRCLDVACWQEKEKRALNAKIAEVEKQHGRCELVSSGDYMDYQRGQHVEKMTGRKTIHGSSVQKAKEGEKGAVPALTITPAGVGAVRWIKASTKGNSLPGSASSKKLNKPKSLKERKTELENRRKALVVDQVRERLDKLAEDGKTEFKIVKLPESGDQFKQLAALIVAFGQDCRRDYINGSIELGSDRLEDGWADFKDVASYSPEELFKHLYRQIFAVMFDRLKYFDTKSVGPRFEEARHCCELLGLKCDDYYTQACIEIPEPKSWANLNADGTPKGATPKKKPAKKQKEKADPGKPAKASKAKSPKIVKGKCRECGCTDDDCQQCIEATGEPCVWVDLDHTLCSRCADELDEAEDKQVERELQEDGYEIEKPTPRRKRKAVAK